MSGELTDIIDEIVIIQKAITTPTGEKALALATDEWPPTVAVFPAFVNNEIETVIETGSYRRKNVHLIRMYLLFGAGDTKYSQRARRAWIAAVQAAFDASMTLNGHATLARIRRISHGAPEELGGAYVCAAFDLEVIFTCDAAYAA
jgi:hypothetical protein